MTHYIRSILFFILCIGGRLAFALLARYIIIYDTSKFANSALILLSIIVASALLSHFLFDTRQVAIEAGGLVWWNAIRPIHASIFILFAAYSTRGYTFAWMFLIMDLIVGIIAWCYNYMVPYIQTQMQIP